VVTVAILDYDCGNVRSIANAFVGVNAAPVLTRDPRAIQTADALVIPGVGAFANAMESLRRYQLIDEIYRFADSGKHILGICLGMQLLFEQSEEFGLSRGLGLIRGSVKKLPVTVDARIRLPHIAWNTIYPSAGGGWEDCILSDTEPYSKVYFVHSYAPVPESSHTIMSLTTYGDCQFVSSVRAGRIFGCQFHPEKSRETGLLILREFVKQSEDVKYARHAAGQPTNDRGVLRIAAPSPVLHEVCDIEPETQFCRRIQE
jgi:glutamine amidotransferase